MLSLLLAPLALSAHMVSISTGELYVEGNRARYELKMPLYEIEGMDDPREVLFDSLELRSAAGPGHLDEVSCAENRTEDSYECDARYEFSAPVEVLDVKCAFYAVTTPNHVHILRARKGETVIQEVFDFSASRARIDFVPPSAWEIAKRQIGSGARRSAGGLASLLFLLAMVVAARRRLELLALTGMFLAGQVAAVLFTPLVNWLSPAAVRRSRGGAYDSLSGGGDAVASRGGAAMACGWRAGPVPRSLSRAISPGDDVFNVLRASGSVRHRIGNHRPAGAAVEPYPKLLRAGSSGKSLSDPAAHVRPLMVYPPPPLNAKDRVKDRSQDRSQRPQLPISHISSGVEVFDSDLSVGPDLH